MNIVKDLAFTNAYSGFAGHSRVVHFLPTQSAALVESNEKLIIAATRSIDIDAVWVVHIARTVDQSSKGAIEANDHFHVFVRTLGDNVYKIMQC